MAYRRSITARTKQFYEQYQVAPSFSTHIHRDYDNHENLPHNRPISNNPQIPNYFQRRLGNNLVTFRGSRNFFNDRRFSIPAASGPAFVRNMSSLGKGPTEKIMTDVADKAVEVEAQVGPMVNEVAVAEGDSFPSVAALQHLIDYVHTFGFNWSTSSLLPLLINQIKSTSKFTLLRPQLEEIKEDMHNRDMSPAAVAEGQARMEELFKEYGVTRFTPLKGHLMSSPFILSVQVKDILNDRSRNFFNDRRFSIPAACGPSFVRNMSTVGKGPAEKIEMMTNVADVLAAQVPSKQIQSNMNILRPLSPHLPIYKPQLSSTRSIFHRISGVFLTTIVLFFYLLYLKIGLICFTYESVYQFFFYSSKLIPISVELTALALSYHILALFAKIKR